MSRLDMYGLCEVSVHGDGNCQVGHMQHLVATYCAYATRLCDTWQLAGVCCLGGTAYTIESKQHTGTKTAGGACSFEPYQISFIERLMSMATYEQQPQHS